MPTKTPRSTQSQARTGSQKFGSSPLLTAPELSVAKGGGSMKGLDGGFRANPVTGSATVSIPLPLSPGRGGEMPALGLSYDSGSGNGPFGLGWNLDAPSIARQTARRLPLYDDGADSDVFSLSGFEDLVPVEDLAQTMEDGGISYRIRRYRPRAEGSFSRIERWSPLSREAFHWRIYGSDGSVSYYGDAPESRIFDPVCPERIFRWLLSYRVDSLGHVACYRYDGPLNSPERHLSRALYGNITPFALSPEPADYHFELALRYENRPDQPVDYRAGFAIPLSMRCAEMRMAHRFDGKPLPPDGVVKTVSFEYAETVSHDSLLVSARHTGYRLAGNGALKSKSLPTLDFEYQSCDLWNEEWRDFSLESVGDIVGGLSSAQWVDLWGEGLPGILSERGGWWYKRNTGNATFAPAKAVSPRPRPGKASGLLDIEGDGDMWLAEHGGSAPGASHLNADGHWSRRQPFLQAPHVDYNSPRVRFLDLDGDGRAEVVVDDVDRLTYYPSEGADGYGTPIQRRKEVFGERPQLIARGKTEAVFLADMSGDGIADVVRVRNAEVCYWPGLGHGRFGEKIVMRNSPHFDHAGLFDPSRVQLANLDGSGGSDVLYVGDKMLHIWLNGSGHCLYNAPSVALPGGAGTRVEALDLMGQGIMSLVWSSPLSANANRPAKYLNLLSGKKPYVMSSARNGMGGETRLEYAASTAYYLEDREKGEPWATKLPYAVQCLSRSEIRDLVTGWTHASRYSYHHGCHDGFEREFRGFGRVDQWDCESGSDPSTDQAPVLRRTWFHLGVAPDGKWLPEAFSKEYWRGAEPLQPDADSISRLEPELFKWKLSPREWKEAHRAFKGLMLREEVYGLEGSAKERATPYAVTDRRYDLVLHGRSLTPGDRFHAATVWQATEKETIARYQERDEKDARFSQNLVLEKDVYGRPTLAASVAYGRSAAAMPADTPARVKTEQQKRHVAVTQNIYTRNYPAPNTQQDSDHRWRMGMESSARAWELTGANPASPGEFFKAEELKRAFGAAAEIPFEAEPSSGLEKRLVESSSCDYWNDSLTEARTDGTCGLLGLARQSYALAWTEGLLEHVYGADKRPDADMLRAGGYAQREENGPWQLAGGVHVYGPNAAERFFLPIGVTDPFGNTTNIAYDPYNLLVESVTDALGNAATAQNDYRTLSPWKLTDPNGNRTAVETDALGMVIKTAAMGKNGASEGDTLEDPTAKMKYGFAAFDGEGKLIQPAWVRTSARETHGDSNFRWLEKVEYSDGLGSVILTKVQAEPGLAKKWNPETKTVEEIYTDKRWVGTGRTILNNKGNPVKQYEPYFSITNVYESEAEIVETGVTPILHYDALSRLIRTDYPDGTYGKVEFTAWEQKDFDQNDTDIGNPHFGTPTAKHLDSLGRIICAVQDNGKDSQGNPLLYETFMELDIEGNEKSVTDARGNAAMAYKYGIHGEKGYSKSADAGERMLFITVDGQPLLTWDGTERRMRAEYDALRRPKEQWLSVNGGDETLVGLTEYGENSPNAAENNLLGKPWKSYDQSGKTENTQFDFKGNLLEGKRQYTVEYKQTIDWNVDEPNVLLQEEIFTTITNYDALNRATNIKTPHNAQIPASEVLPGYDAGGMLNAVNVKIRGAETATSFVSNITYNPKSQRERIQYGNGATTGYSYDEKTFRLKRLLTTRNNGTDVLQNLNYEYDPMGNIKKIADNAQQTIFFNGQVVSPSQTFEYDALYRLTKAEGREHISMGADSEPEIEGYNPAQISPEDGSAMRNYARQWEYDQVGNILALIHQANANSWTRNYSYATDSNRLNGTTVGQTTLNYSYNENGSMSSMPHLQSMEWDFAERLAHITRGATEAYYNYDGSGQRARKVVEKGNIIEERLYLGGFEIFRKKVNGTLDMERETLHVMDDAKRIAVVETPTVDNGTAIVNPISVMRYQLGNHLESASLELDEEANIISYEEYYPYGDTSYRAGRNVAETGLKRYRYTGKEKDEESGLYYYEARYYACWLGRWTAADPAGMVDGTNLYAYCRGNPVKLVDPEGTQTVDDEGNTPELDEVTIKADKVPNDGQTTIGGIRGGAGGEENNNITNKKNKSLPALTNNPIYFDWDDIDWPSFSSSILYNKSTRITLDESGTNIASIETTTDKILTTEIYSPSGELLYSGPEVGIQNYYNDLENRGKNEKRLFLGDITKQARQYFEAFQRHVPVFDLLRSGTNAKFDFKGTEWINENDNSIVILAGYVMTLRDAGNFLFGYSAKAKGYPASFIAWGGGFDEQNKGMINKIKGLAEYPIIIPEFKYTPPYFGEAPRSANMSYLGMSLLAPRK